MRSRLVAGAIVLLLMSAPGCARRASSGVSPTSSVRKPSAGQQSRTTHAEVPFIRPSIERVFHPAGVVVASDGSVCIADWATGLVKKFSRQGKCTDSFKAAAPGSIADGGLLPGPSGSLIVVAEYMDLVRRFAPSGRLLGAMRPESRLGSFRTKGVATDSRGNVYLAGMRTRDEIASSRAVAMLSATGDLRWVRTVKRGASGEVSALAVDPSGQVWAWLEEGISVLVLDSHGDLKDRKECGKYAEGAWIVAAGFDGAGNRYEVRFNTVAGAGTSLSKLDSKGTEVWHYYWTAMEATGLAIDTSGHAYVALRNFKFTAPVCVEVDANGKWVRDIGFNGTEPGELRDPSGLAIDRVGNLYVGEYYNYRVQKFSPEGTFLGKFVGPDAYAGEPEELDIALGGYYGEPPCSVAADAEGRIYISHSAPDGREQTITVFSPMGKPIRRYPKLGYGGYTKTHFGASPVYPASAVVDSRRHLWAAMALSPVAFVDNPNTGQRVPQGRSIRVWKFDRQGEELLSFGKYGTRAAEFGLPEMAGIGTALLAVDTEDNLWVADPANDRVQKFDQEGNYRCAIASRADGRACFDQPWGVATDGQGHVYVADATRIQEFDSGGRFLALVAHLEEPTGKPHDVWPYRGIAVDAHRIVYITDSHNDSVRKFVPKAPVR